MQPDLFIWGNNLKGEIIMFNMIIAGVGGQGSILASHIFAEAAIRASVTNGDNDIKVRVGETFGAAMRGGSVASHVKIGSDVYSPLVPEDKADVILGLEPLETLRVGVNYIAPGGMVIMNIRKYESFDVKTGQAEYPSISDIIDSFKKLNANVITLDATEIAIKAGTAKVMNVVMLGALAACPKNPVPNRILEEVIKDRVPSKTIEVNLKAFELGFNKVSEDLRK
jgi:indolepyruvate ferredoxin oxidoreductase beta subunit